ncbi:MULTISPECIES: 2-C-methyl-D-erythritol 4-phosphate cytidylyltransferase [unclassified Staphylococcus]|uniref:2-C-methyl-D-erythritol 4-phosphate cytidylyltransferase n=1 Tax=unclassified Staphylococcus TaxID=91994 RepID=UPI0021D0DC1B|nr:MULTISPECIES: 2-C-methyl-D-erythritol 4-phosphate cytidylyltransferase [unclassified Staphylococcus]UXR69794.1 2-C-methyl-D-erythritol 4-phosphate cytidylyltransferase [Staphylococcus sp. IVB6246]UXR71830.1 2-C-methyl-D-erythritol 4-phosphate cytidylyltransferase [Staphylococcus sp. IVB6240]UXR74136.1 2-C-methyl-D-erythritol 4-phosphate cytidylyltransferase [Staphylococcus sp. IVB6238]UXR76527.1 2-C-methyl-D-erythritol 4-phosphate cytidylyltransferase [Staphylococcus sp. IVB6233]UXR80655.1 
MTDYHVIIPAAGKGTRMGRTYNKLLIEISQQTIIEHTVHVFQQDPACKGIYLAVQPEDQQILTTRLACFDKVKGFIEGGRERQESIHKVIDQLELPGEDVVLVHDGARPFITQSAIHDLADAIHTHGAAVIGVKAKDTIKVVRDQFVTETLDRNYLWQVQTPQGATYQVLKDAYDQARTKGIVGTDDASLLEYAGHSVFMVEGNYDNIKVTTEEDLTNAQAIIEKRSGIDHV